jgi:phosphoglycolate phosphatase-like HAD superfamily hydrolase
MSVSRVTSVIFDFDGTLINSFDDIVTAANHVLGTLGQPAEGRLR